MIDLEASFSTALSFDDVLLEPQRTRARSRQDVNLSARLTRNIRLTCPVVSANTAWCTGAAMAVAMAASGGIGFIHRVATIAEEVEEVHKVKGTRLDPERWPQATIDAAGRPRVGASVGVARDASERAERLVAAGVDLLVVDVAHGHADHTLETVVALKAAFPDTPIVAGNVATAAGTTDLIEAGADAVKVGIGPGGVCTTRLVTAAGVPQLTAIFACAQAARPHGVPVIADGGIRSSGDIVKALAAGAETVMLGSLLAGANESSALPVEADGRMVKTTTGFVTFGMALMQKRLTGEPVNADELRRYVPEGVEATFQATGPVADTLLQLMGGVASGCSYSGALSLDELRMKARFIRITAAGRAENGPHVLGRAPQLALDFARDAAG
ncbi:IMP dehydrogenase [Azospirillum sp. B506]|uniref:IMP dehydrogenase n=1 Tax=Azospirillum sp. B506 TaxID=137721 RepID=UPI00034CC3F4|nr:IMP dehydrogenase [Azospirillum sp. B506]